MIKFRNLLRKYFFTGIATILPLVITFWILNWLFSIIDRVLFQPILLFIKDYIQSPWIEISVKILILFLFIFLLAFLGYLINLLFFRKLFAKIENLIFKFPFVGKIYKSIKQISMAIVGEGRNIFKKVVLVEYPAKGKYCIGFLTAEAEELFNQASKEELVAVFIPTTPNPTSGMLVYYPKDSITVLNLSIEEGMRIVISAGTVVMTSDDSQK